MKKRDPKICVGPVRFVFAGDDAETIRYDAWPYRDFFRPTGREDESRALVSILLNRGLGMPDMPDREPDFCAGNNWAVWTSDQTMRFCSGFAERDKPRFACNLSAAMDAGELYVDGDAIDRPLRYPLDQVLTWGLLGRCSGLLLHAAAVVRDGVGYVLAGRSGAGKSTFSGFCRARGWDVLNDDRIIVYPDSHGNWQVSGTPWHGSGLYANNRTVPLNGIYMLEQADGNAVTAISPRQAQFALMDVTSIAWFSGSWSQAALDTLARVCAEVPIGRLSFMQSPAAVDCLGLEVAA